MKRFVDWVTTKASGRLRREHIKLLYQNQHAADYLYAEQEVLHGAGLTSLQGMEELMTMQTFVSREVIALTVRNSLTPEESSLHLKINRLLRDVYARSNEGRRKARAWQGEATGDLVPFETRFCPATGWAGMSNTEWDRMVRRALR